MKPSPYDLEVVSDATQAAIAGCQLTPGLKVISAGNYDGRLGNNFIYLRPEAMAGTNT